MEQGTGDTAHGEGLGFMKLHAWQKADDLASEIFRLTEKEIHPKHRWLSLQAVRAAFSVASNIAEGYGRSSLADYARFLELGGASLNEVENAIHFMKKNEVLSPRSLALAEDLRKSTGNLLFALSRSLRAKLRTQGTWQRGLVREPPASYEPHPRDDEPTFPVPSSQFPVPSSQFPDSEA